MREDALARLAVVRRAAAQVPADRRAHHHRARKEVARPVPHHRHLVAQLHHRRPDVVEELNLHHRLDAPRRHPDGPPNDVGFGQRRVEHPRAAVGLLQAVRHLEHTALALHFRKLGFVCGIRHVLTEHDNARVARHFIFHGVVDGRHHGVGLGSFFGWAVEPGARRVDVGRIHEVARSVFGRLRGLEGGVCGFVHFRIHGLRDLGEVAFGGQAFGLQPRCELRDRIPSRFIRPLRRRLVQLLIV